MKLKFKITFAIATILAVASWVIAVYYWDKLPSVIPIHFGISGAADGWADKSIFQVFLLPLLQAMILLLFVFIYYRPQYSNIPTTMWLAALDDKNKARAYELIRTLHAGVLLIVGTMFTYLTYSMNASALVKGRGLSSPFLFLIIGLMLIWIVYWTVRVYRATKAAITSIKKR